MSKTLNVTIYHTQYDIMTNFLNLYLAMYFYFFCDIMMTEIYGGVLMKKLQVVSGIICYGDKILCMKRPEGKHEYTSLKYEFPGGKIESGESKVEALKRELLEEMDMKVELDESNAYLVVNYTYPDLELTMYSYIFNVDSKDFVMKEHKDFKWLKREELSQLDWATADIPIVKKLMSKV